MNAVNIFAACEASATDSLQQPPPPPTFSFSTDSLHDLTDGVFIFEAVSTEDSRTTQGYDAIVVEQWTVLDVSVGLGRDAFRLDRGGFIRSLLRVRLPLDSRWTAGHPEDPCCPWGPSCAPKVGEGPPLFPFHRKHTSCVPDHWAEKILIQSSERSK